MIKQKAFLTVNKNKEQIIKLLCRELDKAGCRTKVTDEDTDMIITLQQHKNEQNTIVVIIGNVTDLLVI